MNDFILAPVARADLHEIWDYYASEIQNVEVADRIRDELFAAFDDLAQTPGMGHYRSDLVAEPRLTATNVGLGALRGTTR